MNIVSQLNRKMTYKGTRLYIDWVMFSKFGFEFGSRITTETNPATNEVTFKLDENGTNKISKKVKKGNIIPVIDKASEDIRSALEGCDQILIFIVETNGEYHIIVKGEKNTKTSKMQNQEFDTNLKSITFCAGSGISTEAMKLAGFDEVAAIEWNPKEGNESKFADLYSSNNPNSMIFNVPMEQVKSEHLPYADVWLATLDCTDYSKSSNGTNKQLHTMHLFMHLMRLFWEKPKLERPNAILIENVPEFEKVAGNSLELCFKEEGFYVSKAQLNSLDYGSRTQRKRFFFLATLFEGFTFPLPTGKNISPIIADGNLAIDDLEWVTPETDKTLFYFLDRQKGKMSHNHKMTVFDITKDAYIGTITKSHHKKQPENWIKHPTKEDTYAYLKAEHIRLLQGIPQHLNLGDSNKMKVECIGQSVCYTIFKRIAYKLHSFLTNSIKKVIPHEDSEIGQLAFAI